MAQVWCNICKTVSDDNEETIALPLQCIWASGKNPGMNSASLTSRQQTENRTKQVSSSSVRHLQRLLCQFPLPADGWWPSPARTHVGWTTPEHCIHISTCRWLSCVVARSFILHGHHPGTQATSTHSLTTRDHPQCPPNQHQAHTKMRTQGPTNQAGCLLRDHFSPFLASKPLCGLSLVKQIRSSDKLFVHVYLTHDGAQNRVGDAGDHKFLKILQTNTSESKKVNRFQFQTLCVSLWTKGFCFRQVC